MKTRLIVLNCCVYVLWHGMKVPIITQPLSGKKKSSLQLITTNKRVQYWGKTDNGCFPTRYVQQVLDMVTPRHGMWALE